MLFFGTKESVPKMSIAYVCNVNMQPYSGREKKTLKIKAVHRALGCDQ